MKHYLIGGAIVLALAVGVFAGSHEGEGFGARLALRNNSARNVKGQVPGLKPGYCGALFREPKGSRFHLPENYRQIQRLLGSKPSAT